MLELRSFGCATRIFATLGKRTKSGAKKRSGRFAPFAV
jgi:hypothetical protein